MPFGASNDFRRQALPKPEFLSYPLETTVIDSVVVTQASGVSADVSGPYQGRRYMIQGTILSYNAGNKTYERYVGGGGQNVAGILFDTIEFADATQASYEPAAMVRRNCSFKADAIVDYNQYGSAVRAALTTCEFV